ncbi:hypothetical protein ACQP3F_32735, partial [Escherichia coli]
MSVLGVVVVVVVFYQLLPSALSTAVQKQNLHKPLKVPPKGKVKGKNPLQTTCSTTLPTTQVEKLAG